MLRYQKFDTLDEVADTYDKMKQAEKDEDCD